MSAEGDFLTLPDWIIPTIGLAYICYMFYRGLGIVREDRRAQNLNKRDYRRDQWKLLFAGLILAALLLSVVVLVKRLGMPDVIGGIIFVAVALIVNWAFNERRSQAEISGNLSPNNDQTQTSRSHHS
jgi:hypothetical protein